MASYTISFILLLSFSLGLAKNSGKFPDDFMFGAATSAYQTEGAWDVDGKGVNIWDTYAHQVPSNIKNNHTGDVACDSYNKWKEDIAIVKELGLTHYRFSISWSRILPNGTSDNINEIGLNYYKELVQELLNNNITPVATIFQWDLPQSFQDVGGLMNVSLVEHFVNYSRIVISALPDVKYWVTFNEPKSICLFGYSQGLLAPGTYQNVYQCAYVLLKSHAETYHMYKEEFPHYTAKMGIVLNIEWSQANSSSTEDVEAAERRINFDGGLYLNPILKGNWPQVVIDRVTFKDEQANLTVSRLPNLTQEEIERFNGTLDYLGINYYMAHLVSNSAEDVTGNLTYTNDVRANTGVNSTWDIGYNGSPVVPFGFRKLLKWIKNGFNSPSIFITECGFSDDGRLNDDSRIKYTKEYLNSLLDAIEDDGVDVFGYTQWSLIDNFEWAQGFTQHFGLYHVNFTDPSRPRTPKKSSIFYKQLVQTLKIPIDN